MKIAVTGAMGHVGKVTCDDLAAHGYDVLAITHHHSDECKYPQITIDTGDFNAVSDAISGCDAVIHLAAIPSPRDDNTSLTYRTNVVGAYNIVLAAGVQGINRVAIASSDCALGITFAYSKEKKVDYLPVDEEHTARPDNGYGISKIITEKTCELLTHRFPEMSISNLRISHVMDPEDYRSERFAKWSTGPELGAWNLWSYIDVRDCASAFRVAIEKNIKGHQVYYIAAKNTRMQIRSIELIRKYYPDAELRIPFTGFESLENTEKAERLLGWKAEHKWQDKA